MGLHVRIEDNVTPANSAELHANPGAGRDWLREVQAEASRSLSWERPRPSSESRRRAEEGVSAMLRHIGEEVGRPGLADTAGRVVHAFEELFAGYAVDPVAILQRTFEETEGYDGMVLLKSIPFVSHSERDFGVFSGEAHIAYLPRCRVVGLSKLPRVVDAFAQRLQTQERLTIEIARAIERGLQPVGVAIIVEASHLGVAARGMRKTAARLQTSCMLGRFRDDHGLRSEFLTMVGRDG